MQISLELHINISDETKECMIEPTKGIANLLLHIIKMHELGYLLLSKELNLVCNTCCELTWIKQTTMMFLSSNKTVAY